jgi:hypothetical protein
MFHVKQSFYRARLRLGLILWELRMRASKAIWWVSNELWWVGMWVSPIQMKRKEVEGGEL